MYFFLAKTQTILIFISTEKNVLDFFYFGDKKSAQKFKIIQKNCLFKEKPKGKTNLKKNKNKISSKF